MLALSLIAPAAADDIRDIRGLIPIPAWWHRPLVIAAVVVVALGVALLVRWWRARPARVASPLELARRALAAAETHALAGRAHEWADIVAETTRGALAARLGTEVLPQTTTELSEAPWARPPVAAEVHAERLLELLETCDLARFARAKLDTKTLLASTATAGDLVERLYSPPRRPPPRSEVPSPTVSS
jgi:hypothetical protein